MLRGSGAQIPPASSAALGRETQGPAPGPPSISLWSSIGGVTQGGQIIEMVAAGTGLLDDCWVVGLFRIC